jgi:ElaB/YqjD/DUF883 family membrane-anchored ribosome-binding protein
MGTRNGLATQLRQKGQELVVDLRDLRGIATDALGAKLAKLKQNASSMARDTGERATAMVRNSPWKAMAGAAAAGMLAAWFFRRR